MSEKLKTFGMIVALLACVGAVAALKHLRAEHRRAERDRIEREAEAHATVEAGIRSADGQTPAEASRSAMSAELEALRAEQRAKQEEQRAKLAERLADIQTKRDGGAAAPRQDASKGE